MFFFFPLVFILTFCDGLLLSHLLPPSFQQEGDVPGELTAEQIDHHFIGAHHDGSVGDLSDEVSSEAAVQCPVSLLSRYSQQCLEKGAILAALLS